MHNLDQIRAAKALAAAADTSRQAVSKLPAMILQNGLLAATAFAAERTDRDEAKRKEMDAAIKATADHLADPRLGISILKGKNNATAMMTALSSRDATAMDLQRATTEALAFLAYLKRYTNKDTREAS